MISYFRKLPISLLLLNSVFIKSPNIIILAYKIICLYICQRPWHYLPAYKHKMKFSACKRFAYDTRLERFQSIYRSNTCQENRLSQRRLIIAKMFSQLDIAKHSSFSKCFLLPYQSIPAIRMVGGCAMQASSLLYNAIKKSGWVM